MLPCLNWPRSPPFFEEGHVENWRAASSKASSPDSMEFLTSIIFFASSMRMWLAVAFFLPASSAKLTPTASVKGRKKLITSPTCPSSCRAGPTTGIRNGFPESPTPNPTPNGFPGLSTIRGAVRADRSRPVDRRDSSRPVRDARTKRKGATNDWVPATNARSKSIAHRPVDIVQRVPAPASSPERASRQQGTEGAGNARLRTAR
mmetsp:Transcript_36913/g.91888  ORF Transcript_36913/g.91888 Transcript_36913/m.91888 type:complete len:204 (-) Transcript_36913:141-752(-)